MSGDRFAVSCPTPLSRHTTVQMAHGGGGRLMRELLEHLILPAFADSDVAGPHDSAVVNLGGAKIAFTTDSYVVHPLTFPGGDIGTLAVYGTVNDLAMAGARPTYLSAAFILEEGCSLETLGDVVGSMRAAADDAGVALITGDTKVVDRGKADGIFINTSGIGLVPPAVDVRPQRVHPGDLVLLSGDVGRHGVAILPVRQGLEFESTIESDCAPLASLVAAMLEADSDIHCLRDLTRGGLASALNEIALDGGGGIVVNEQSIPVNPAVAGACELLGLDPLYVANEGRLVAFVAADRAEAVLARMRGHSLGQHAAIIGHVVERGAVPVTLKGRLGGYRRLDLLTGEQLPRIC